MYTKYYKILFAFFLFPILSSSQSHGFSFDNYSGIYGVIANPANSVDSKYKIHVNVLSYQQFGLSDIGGFTNFQVETAPNGFNGLAFDNNLTNGEEQGYSFGHSDILLPSVSWNFSEKFAVGLLLRSRNFYDYNGVSSSLLQAVNEGLPEGEFDFENSTLNNTSHSWGEIGLNLSAVVIDANYHFIKFGGTFKYYIGSGGNEVSGSLGGVYNGTNLNLNTINEPLTTLSTFANSSDEKSSKSFINGAVENFSGAGSGIGGDIGLVYEWRPRETNRVDVRSNSSAVNKYKLKISASVLDIGTITYEKATRRLQSLNNFSLSRTSYDPSLGLLGTLAAESDAENVTNDRALGDVTFALPMSAHLNLDYIILNNNNYYVNINYIKGLTTASDAFANTQMDLITVTPRYETRKFSVYLPVNFEPTTNVIAAGLGFRYGPVTVGTAALSSMLLDGKMRHLYVGVSIPLMKELYR